MTSLDEIIGAGANTSAPEKETIAPAASFDKSSGEQTTEQPLTAEGAEAVGEGEDSQKQVPLAALQAERAKAKRYTEQVAEFQQKLQQQDEAWNRRFEELTAAIKPKQEVQEPDYFDDPKAAVKAQIDEALRAHIDPLREAQERQRHHSSELQAVSKYGGEAVDAAFQAIAGLKTSSPQVFNQLYQRIDASLHPFGSLVEWHKQQQAMSEIGNDPAAYKEKIEAEVRAKVLAELNAGGLASPVNGTTMPSNFATARNAGNRSGPAWGGPTPLQDIFAKR